MWPFRKRYTPWELYSANVEFVKETNNIILGHISTVKVRVDIYVKYNKKTRFPKYKYIEKPMI